MSNKKTIEFFGLPGSGKTYLTKRDYNPVELTFTSLSDRIKKYALALLYEFLHPIRSAKFIVGTMQETKNNQLLLLHKLKFLYLNTEAREMMLKLKKTNVIDEGLAQYLLSLFERKIVASDVIPYVNILPHNRFVYIVVSDKTKREERMKKRNRKPRQKFGEAYQKKRDAILEHNFNVIADVLRERLETETIQN